MNWTSIYGKTPLIECSDGVLNSIDSRLNFIKYPFKFITMCPLSAFSQLDAKPPVIYNLGLSKPKIRF